MEELVTQHAPQFTRMGLPLDLWEKALVKISQEDYDAGSSFIVNQVQQEETISLQVQATQDLKAFEEVWLVDNWFTFSLRDLRQTLLDNPKVIDRIQQVTQSEQDEEVTLEHRVDQVTSEMWRYMQCYAVHTGSSSDHEYEPVWYLMDILGCHIGHSDDANARLAPFIFAPTFASYSLLWLNRDVSAGDQITRDFVFRVEDKNLRAARLRPWFPHLPIEPCELHETDYRRVADSRLESLPKTESEGALASKEKLVVYTQCPNVHESLKSPKFELLPLGSMEDEAAPPEADVLWLSRHHKRFDLSEAAGKFVNQFPGEHLIVCKDLCAEMACRSSGAVSTPERRRVPSWFQNFYNLKYELPRFVHDWDNRGGAGDSSDLGKTWIVKPWNYARALATHVSRDLHEIIRLTEIHVPLIAFEYIERPVLFHRDDIDALVKFDYRICVAVQSMRPLRVFAHHVVWFRFANIAFSLDDLSQYERHFTVMNYKDTPLLNLLPHQFLPKFSAQYPRLSWPAIVSESHQAIKHLLEGASDSDYPAGVFQAGFSRALYAVDLMLKWRPGGEEEEDVQPVILEVNFNPDTDRAVKYYPEFYDDVFELLFHNQWSESKFKLL